MKKEELRNVDGSDSLHPNRSGDVVVVLKPPYQFDAATFGQTIAFSQFFGQHGYLPETVDFASGVNMHATFVAAGPGIRKQDPVAGVRAVDLAPTLSFLLGFPGPINARGKILYNLLPSPGQYKEASILYITDFHGQLTPLSQTADTFGSPSYAIGGAAFLKPWFDWYRAEAKDGVITLAGGDSVGATPPISNFFGDKPTMMTLNMLGMSADTLGNHNFDRGSQYLRTELIPMAQFPYLAANVVFQNNNKLPPEWKASEVFQFEGFKLGVVGYTLPELPTLIFPGYLDPFKVTDPAAAINAEVAKLKSKGKLNAVIAVGHMGGDGTNITNPDPDSPLVQLADSLVGVDAVFGGHTHYPVHQLPAQRRAGNGDPQRRPTLQPHPPGRGHEHQSGDLQDGRLPQALGYRRDAGSSHPGADRRTQHGTGTDLQHGDRQLDPLHPAGGCLRPSGWPAVRIA